MPHPIASLLLSAALTAPFPPAAEPPPAESPVLASVDGDPLTEEELRRFVAVEYRAGEDARRALDDLVSERLVAVEAERRGLRVEDHEIEARFDAYARRFAETSPGAGGFEAYLQREGIDRGEFLATLRPVLLLERCVAQDFGLAANEPVPEEKMHLWLQDRRAQAHVAPGGGPDRVATVDGTPITTDAFGQRLLRGAGHEQVRDWLNELVGVRVIERAAAQRRLELRDAEIEAAVDRWEQEFQARHGGEVALRELLLQRGLTREHMRGSRLLRAKLAMERLTDESYGETELRALFAAHEGDFQDQAGRTAKLRVVFLKAGTQGAVESGFVPRTFEDAERELAALRARIADGAVEFAAAATERSEHASAAAGGELGTVRSGGSAFPGLLLRRALDATGGKDGIAGPLRFPEGVFLAEVRDAPPPRPFEELRPLVRARARTLLFQTLKDAARIERRP